MSNIFGAILFLFVFLIGAAVCNAQTPVSPRVTYTINDNWRFSASGGENAAMPVLSDKSWETVNIPYTWNAVDAFDDKPGHYFYKANFSREPILHIAATDWKFRGATDSAAHKIDVYSNLAEVELFLNGKSLGKKQPTASRKATWDVNFRDGENILTATGARDGANIYDSAKIHFKIFDVNSPEIAVNVGSNAQFIDESKTVWLADQPYKTGGWGFTGSEAKAIYAAQTDDNVLNTPDDPLYQTMQENLTAYRFDVPKGAYEVELKFVETASEKAGERVFSVKINNQTVCENLDLAKEAGQHYGVARRFRVNSGGGIIIDFAAKQGKPILSAIRIRRLSAE